MTTKTRIKWSTKDCGGIQVHGTASCSSEGCYCPKKPSLNYPLYYALMQTVYSLKDEEGNRLKPHAYVKNEHGILEKWERVLVPIKKHPLFSF